MKRSIVLLTIVVASIAVGSPVANTETAPPQPGALVVRTGPELEPRVPSRRPTTATPAPKRVNPDPKHPTGKLIEIDISKQRLRVWNDGTLVMRFKISTGKAGYETPTGRYRILWKTKMGWSRKWNVWMPWAMQWKGNYMIHELARKSINGPSIEEHNLGKPASHGCVRVGRGDAERLYRWTSVGTPVWVHRSAAR